MCHRLNLLARERYLVDRLGSTWRRRITAVVVSTAAAAALSVTTAGTAHAQVAPEDNAPVAMSESANGASATCTVPTTLTEIDCVLTDTKADSHSVFIEWAIDDDEDRFTNSNGSRSNNTARFVEGGLNQDGSASTIHWRVCTDVQIWGDDCSEIVVIEAANAPVELYCYYSTPPSPSIPPDLQPPPSCYPVEPDPRFSEADKCMRDVGLAVLGLSWESWEVRNVIKSGGKVVLSKVGPGVVLTVAGVTAAVNDCAL